MDIGIERNTWAQSPLDEEGVQTAPLDWHGLITRLSAARAARRVLTEAAGVDTLGLTGSFDCGSAKALADYAPHTASVNPVFWVNGKPARTMDAAVAEQFNPGDRG